MPFDPFEERLRERLQDAQLSPGPELWESIAARVAEEPARRKPIFWWLMDGLMAGLVLSLFLFPTPPESANRYAALAMCEETPPVAIEFADPSSLPATATNASSQEIHEGAITQSLSSSGLSASNRTKSPAVGSTLPVKRVSSTLLSSETQRLHPNQQPIVASFSEEASKQASFGPIQYMDQPAIPLPFKLTQTIPDIQPQPPLLRSNWAIRFSAGQSMAPSTQGWVWKQENRSADIRASYPRGLGGTLQTEEEIHTLRLPHLFTQVGIQAEYQLRPAWSLETGLLVNHSNQGQYQLGYLSGQQPVGPTPRDLLIEYEPAYHFKHTQLEIPLRINAFLQQGNGRWALSAGTVLGYTRAWQVEQVGSGQIASEGRALLNASDDQVIFVRPWYAQVEGRLLYHQPLGPRTEFFIGPTVRHHLTGRYGGLQSVGQSRSLLGLTAGIRLQH